MTFCEMPNKQRWIVCDIDGTLADINKRLQFILDADGQRRENPNWEAFHKAMSYDNLIRSTYDILRLARQSGWKIALSTGRNEQHRGVTEWWLRANAVPYDLLLMRPLEDNRSDVDVKRDHWNTKLKKLDVAFWMEDRDKVVELVRSLGIVCHQVQKGAY